MPQPQRRRVVVLEREGRRTVRVTYGSRTVHEPERPSDPRRALDCEVLAAWIDAARSWAASGGGRDFDQMVDGAIETAVQRWLGVQSGEIRISRYWTRIPEQFREHFGRKEAESLKALIGGTDREGRWQR